MYLFSGQQRATSVRLKGYLCCLILHFSWRWRCNTRSMLLNLWPSQEWKNVSMSVCSLAVYNSQINYFSTASDSLHFLWCWLRPRCEGNSRFLQTSHFNFSDAVGWDWIESLAGVNNVHGGLRGGEHCALRCRFLLLALWWMAGGLLFEIKPPSFFSLTFRIYSIC